METFVIFRRDGWQDADELTAAAARSKAAGERMSDEVRWIRSYALAEPSGRVGTVCIYQATDEDAIRRHAAAADLPVDQVVRVADTVVVRDDPVAV